jgi:hypothetical protein
MQRCAQFDVELLRSYSSVDEEKKLCVAWVNNPSASDDFYLAQAAWCVIREALVACGQDGYGVQVHVTSVLVPGRAEISTQEMLNEQCLRDVRRQTRLITMRSAIERYPWRNKFELWARFDAIVRDKGTDVPHYGLVLPHVAIARYQCVRASILNYATGNLLVFYEQLYASVLSGELADGPGAEAARQTFHDVFSTSPHLIAGLASGATQ